MIAVLRREHREPLSVHPHLAERAEIRVAARHLADATKPQRARLLVHAQELRHVADTTRDLALQLSGGEVIEVQLPPIVPLREPDHLVRRRQHAPVHLAVARLELRRHGLLEHVADGARCHVGDTELRALVVARRGHKGDARSVRVPLHIGPLPASARDVVAERGTVLVGGHLKPRDGRRIDVDDDALDRRDDAVTGERIGPRRQHRMPGVRVDQVHHPHAALVLLEGRDLPRVGRPHHDRAVRVLPARIVRRIAEALHAVLRELRLLAGGDVLHPEVEVLDVDGALPVGGPHFGTRPTSASTTTHRLRGRSSFAIVHCRTTSACRHIAIECPRVGTHANGAVRQVLVLRERQRIATVRRARCGRESRRELRLVEREPTGALDRIHQDELRTASGGGAIPEALAREPGRANRRTVHERARVGGERAFRAPIIVGGEGAGLLGAGRGRRDRERQRTSDDAKSGTA